MIQIRDLLAVLEPVLDWYQSDEHPERDPLDILRDIVADLQSDRADLLTLRTPITADEIAKVESNRNPSTVMDLWGIAPEGDQYNE